ncbi:MAG: PASTA domain-containing protein, partial [Armatimonadota bacterium]|nr:PASTA domain-containing protein [Armatimonadota bacterium]
GMRVREPSSVLGRVMGIIFVLAVLSVIGLVWYFVKDFAQPPNDVSVPYLIGKTFDDAKRIAEQQHFTLVESPDSDYSDTMPENQIYEQNPLPGHMIKAEKEVTIYRSLGPRLLIVPTLVGMTQDRANSALQQVNLPLGNITQEYSEKIPNGVVIRQSPDGSSKVARNTAVNFTVSKGKQPPDTPSDVAGSPDGPDKATLHWHSAPRAESYTILRSLDGDTTTIARGLPDTNFTDTNLKPNTTYSYTINAVNSAGESGPSESVLVTTDAKPDVQPVLPDNVPVTPPDTTGTVPDSSGSAPDSSDSGDGSKTARMRPFTIDFRVPRHPRRTRHVQIEVQDTTGNNLVYDENHEPGELVSAPIQAFGNKITFRIFLDSNLVKQETL